VLLVGKIYKNSPSNRRWGGNDLREKILDAVAVTRRFQVTLTKPVREIIEVKEGDRVVFIEKGGEVVIRKA